LRWAAVSDFSSDTLPTPKPSATLRIAIAEDNPALMKQLRY
jgi:hypothetical protein